VLLLVGGSHLGPRGLGQDVIAALGELKLTGMDLEPGGVISAGMIGDKPVFALPGSLPDVLAGIVLLVRPLLHKYTPPHQFEDRAIVELEGASRLRFDSDMALPVRLRQQDGRYDAKLAGGRRDDPWLRYTRGQALVVIEGGVEYQDGAELTAYLY
jgi:molybdopterin biosynthesis enzyme